MKKIRKIAENENYTAVSVSCLDELAAYSFVPSDERMVYICVQARENSLKEHTTDDGGRVVCESKWNT